MLELKKRYNKKIVVTGCLVERYLDDLKNEIPEVDYYIPIKDYPKLNKIFEVTICVFVTGKDNNKSSAHG